MRDLIELIRDREWRELGVRLVITLIVVGVLAIIGLAFWSSAEFNKKVRHGPPATSCDDLRGLEMDDPIVDACADAYMP